MKSKSVLVYLLLTVLITFSCSKDDSVTEPAPQDEGPLTSNLRTFFFGHSLISHLLQVNVTPSDETSIPHWMYLMAQESGYSYSATGQFGFLTSHRDLPPEANMLFDLMPGVWDSDTQTFGEGDFNTVVLTPANFIQHQSATTNYANESYSPVDATVEIFDWVMQQEPGMTIYLYEGWPDMGPFIQSFPPTPNELADFHDYTAGDFHDWWLDYQDEIIRLRPDLNVRMIPAGPILERILTETALNQLEITEIYEDDAPHGRATLYFLSSMITYMAMYGIETPATYQAPPIIHPAVNENYETLVTIVWEELEAFNNPDGSSRVW